MPGLSGPWALERRSGEPEGAGRHGPALQASASHAWLRSAGFAGGGREDPEVHLHGQPASSSSSIQTD
eukprot:5040934-Heterocapsa_arctica.AAC.1